MKLIGLFFFRITQSLSKRGKTFFRNSKFLIAKNNFILIKIRENSMIFKKNGKLFKKLHFEMSQLILKKFFFFFFKTIVFFSF